MEQMLMRLAVRFGAYRDATKDAERIFPHEMGIFLGYPLGDVKGFIVHGGKTICIPDTGRSMRMWKKFERSSSYSQP